MLKKEIAGSFLKLKIVELWDLGQEFMKDSPNTNGPF